MRFAPLLYLSFMTSACGGAVMSAPRTAAPVLLGPVDRVGGHTSSSAAGDPTVTTTTSEGVSLFVVGPYISGDRYDTGAVPATVSILDATDARDDRDVRVTSLRSGGHGNIFAGYFAWRNESTLRGAVTKVSK